MRGGGVGSLQRRVGAEDPVKISLKQPAKGQVLPNAKACELPICEIFLGPSTHRLKGGYNLLPYVKSSAPTSLKTGKKRNGTIIPTSQHPRKKKGLLLHNEGHSHQLKGHEKKE